MNEAWDRIAGGLQAAAAAVLARFGPDETVERAAASEFLAGFLAVGLRLCLERADPADPEFIRWDEPPMLHWGLDCPDCLFLYAPVAQEGTYRIHGSRGSAHHLDVQLRSGRLSWEGPHAQRVDQSLNAFDLEVADDGTLEVFVSPDERAGNWMRSREGTSCVVVRQYFYDWDTERPADLFIERLDTTYPRPRPSVGELSTRLATLADWLGPVVGHWESRGVEMRSWEPNRFDEMPAPRIENREGTGLLGQMYSRARFVCGADEAVIIELAPPECHYWGLSLFDPHWATIDFSVRQSCLNGRQAWLDEDGVFRGVIAQRDPGVFNWLDPGGHHEGTLALRYLFPEACPTPELTAVPLGDLWAHLPAGSRRIERAERVDVLKRRREAVSRRFRW